MKKRLLAAIMSLCMIVSLLPVSALAAPEGERRPSGGNYNPEQYVQTIEVEVEQEKEIYFDNNTGHDHSWDADNPSVASVEAHGWYENNSNGATVTGKSAGETYITHTYYTYDPQWNDWFHTIKHTEYYRVIVNPKEETSWGKMEFGVYYRYDNQIPNNPAGDNTAAHYGPSGNDVPLYTVTIDVDALLEKYPQARETWENGERINLVQTYYISYQTCQTDAENWWKSVLLCMDEDDQARFESGVGNIFEGYILKRDVPGSDTPHHMDGILIENPPLYTVELYEDSTPKDIIIDVLYAESGDAISVQGNTNSVQAALADYLEKKYSADEITWDGPSAGSFTTTDGAYYQIALEFDPQLNDNNLGYTEEVSGYYIAKVIMTLTKMEADWSVTKTVDRVLRGGQEVTANDGFEAQVGDQIFWKIEVKNEGKAPLSGITLNDELNEKTTLSVYSNENCSSESIVTGSIDIAVGETKTYYATYTVQADDSGNLSNTVTASLGGKDKEDTNNDISVQARYTLTVASYLESTSGTKLDGAQYGGTYPMAAGTAWSVEIVENGTTVCNGSRTSK